MMKSPRAATLSRPMLASACAGVLALLGSAVAQAANIHCWTTREGVWQCADRLPPEAAQERADVRNRRGVVVDVREGAKTPEQIEQESRKATQREIERRQRQEQAAYDRMLLATYVDEGDLERARERNLAAADGAVALLERNLATLQTQREALQVRHADSRGATAEGLERDITALERQIATTERQLGARRDERDALARRFEADLARFRTLRTATPR
ncbi:hypothetical protein HUS23_10630 [Ectothiorhodospiraceae bacterium 2226]|nr:hypothetical protein HUS23_10630 [Ectothiorhodospiraceae bacterium 2226]